MTGRIDLLNNVHPVGTWYCEYSVHCFPHLKEGDVLMTVLDSVNDMVVNMYSLFFTCHSDR